MANPIRKCIALGGGQTLDFSDTDLSQLSFADYRE